MANLEKIILKAKTGNQKAFKKLFENYVDMVYNFLRKFENDHDLIEEWTQCTFIKAFNKLDQFSGRSKFSSWLIAISLNEMKSDYRKKSFSHKISLGDYPINELDLSHSVNFEWHHDMELLLEELNDENKEIFVLFEVEGFNHSEISEMLNISEAKSRTTLCRTRKYLKTIIVKSGICYDQ